MLSLLYAQFLTVAICFLVISLISFIRPKVCLCKHFQRQCDAGLTNTGVWVSGRSSMPWSVKVEVLTHITVWPRCVMLAYTHCTTRVVAATPGSVSVTFTPAPDLQVREGKRSSAGGLKSRRLGRLQIPRPCIVIVVPPFPQLLPFVVSAPPLNCPIAISIGARQPMIVFLLAATPSAFPTLFRRSESVHAETVPPFLAGDVVPVFILT